MSKSQETVAKKEKEKKKARKKQDKQEKKEERRANSNKGKGLEEMLAYIDEFGNISSTPPDPKKKEEIDHRSIHLDPGGQYSANKQENGVRKGTVKFFNEEKGYGFINDQKTKESVFVHINQLSEPIKERDTVTFEIEAGPKGRSAVNVKKI